MHIIPTNVLWGHWAIIWSKNLSLEIVTLGHIMMDVRQAADIIMPARLDNIEIYYDRCDNMQVINDVKNSLNDDEEAAPLKTAKELGFECKNSLAGEKENEKENPRPTNARLISTKYSVNNSVRYAKEIKSTEFKDSFVDGDLKI